MKSTTGFVKSLLGASLFTVVVAGCATDQPGITAVNAAPFESSANARQSAAPSDFVVLANAAVTCSNGGITGSAGTFLAKPLGSVTQTGCPISGKVLVGDMVALRAFNDFLDTYATLTPRRGDVCTTLTGTLAGVILAPGNYCFDAAAAVTGVLTLKGSSKGVWNIKIGTKGTGALTGTNFNVVMTGGANACNLTWWVANGATLTDSNFKGNLLAGMAITLTRGTFIGHAWSRSDVTTTGTVVAGC